MTAETAISDAPPALLLRTLGDAGLYPDGASAPLLGPGKPFALLVYLALSPGRRSSREFLLDLLWADLDPERARRALRQALFHLRRLLGDAALAGTEELTLDGAIAIDRNRFLAQLEAGDLEAAVAQYHGAFLPTFGVPGGAAFEHWADLERDRLQAAFLRGAELLVRRQLNQSRFREAQRLAKRARDLVPGEEGAWRLLLEVAIASNDLVTAAVEAEALEEWAERDHTTLDPSTRAVMARARGLTPGNIEDSADAGLTAELTGREREFFVITSAWDASRNGRARHIHLSAAAGLGKSRLLRDACTRLAAAGASVIRVHGTRGDRDVPYAFAGDLAAAVATLPGATGVAPASAATLVALTPTLSSRFTAPPDTAHGEEALRRRIHALVDLLFAVAHEQPVVLAIDDLHWIDQPSYRVLEAILGRLEQVPILCLTAARPERHPTNDACTVLPLPALSIDQLATLIAALGALPEAADWTSGFIGGLHRATSGSPLLVLETLRFAIDQGILALDRNEWQCLDAIRLRALLQAGEALRERVRGLPPSQGWLLALLSTAGAPIEIDQLAIATTTPVDEVRTALGPLEQQGLVVVSNSGWRVAHDEIAAASHAALTPNQRALAERTIGACHARLGLHDADRLLRAARHFAAAGDTDDVTRLFRRYARTTRAHGDRRSFRELARTVADGDAAVDAMVGTLPWSWRAGLWSRPRQIVAAVLFVLVPVLALTAASAWVRDDATVQRLIYSDSLGITSGVPVRSGDWNDVTRPLAPSRRSSDWATAARAYRELPPAVSPDGRTVAWIADSGDSTTLDIWIRTSRGTRRLTSEWGDDLVQGWLPDGSALIGQSSRWSPRKDANYDIAVFDTATGSARQLTDGPAQDTNPYVSPDGTRVAFIRVTEADPPMLCVTAIDGSHAPDCRLIGGTPAAAPVGWLGLDEFALTIDAPSTRPLVRYDWRRDVVTPMLGPHIYRPRLSPDRHWIAAAAVIDGVGGFRDVIFPVAEPLKSRPVTGPGLIRDVLRWWEGRTDAAWLIDHLEFSDSVRTVSPGVATRLTVRARSISGAEIPIRAAIRWQSSDTLVATVDSTGEVRVRSDGVVTITASLAGWRSVSKTVTIAAKSPVPVLNEAWDASWTTRWLPWGAPSPVVTIGPGKIRALWNRGDGSYPSIALLRQGFSARDGLGMEIQLSTPLSYAQHQRLNAYLIGGVDINAFATADQQKAPPTFGDAQLKCGIKFPGEARWGSTRLYAIGSITGKIDLGEAAAPLRTGTWWTLRVQILPDGRCGIAINDRVIWLSNESVPLDRDYRIWLGEESVDTRLLHGPVQVWTGVRTDIRWIVPPPPH